MTDPITHKISWRPRLRAEKTDGFRIIKRWIRLIVSRNINQLQRIQSHLYENVVIKQHWLNFYDDRFIPHRSAVVLDLDGEEIPGIRYYNARTKEGYIASRYFPSCGWNLNRVHCGGAVWFSTARAMSALLRTLPDDLHKFVRTSEITGPMTEEKIAEKKAKEKAFFQWAVKEQSKE